MVWAHDQVSFRLNDQPCLGIGPSSDLTKALAQPFSCRHYSVNRALSLCWHLSFDHGSNDRDHSTRAWSFDLLIPSIGWGLTLAWPPSSDHGFYDHSRSIRSWPFCRPRITFRSTSLSYYGSHDRDHLIRARPFNQPIPYVSRGLPLARPPLSDHYSDDHKRSIKARFLNWLCHDLVRRILNSCHVVRYATDYIAILRYSCGTCASWELKYNNTADQACND